MVLALGLGQYVDDSYYKWAIRCWCYQWDNRYSLSSSLRAGNGRS